jgi:hypothetical protein
MASLYQVGFQGEGNEEYRHNLTFSPKVAFETANAALKQSNKNVTFYVYSDGKESAIPFTDIRHFNMDDPDFEKSLEMIAREQP